MKGALIDIFFYISLVVLSFYLPYQYTNNKIVSLIIMVVVLFFIMKEVIKEKSTGTNFFDKYM